ncbi:hypothetical protein [Streptacidiphilus sp. EB129]
MRILAPAPGGVASSSGLSISVPATSVAIPASAAGCLHSGTIRQSVA